MTITTDRPVELRTQGIELRDIEATESLSMLRGRAVPYGVRADIGWFTEEFEPGALAKSIAESARALPLLMFHDDRTMPIGAAAEWDEEAGGLVGTWKLDGGDVAQRAARLARDGILNFMSIRFAPIRSEWTFVEDFNPDLGEQFKDHVKRTEARLLETSLVSTPAYNQAAVEWVRSTDHTREPAGTRQLDEWAAELERLKAGPR